MKKILLGNEAIVQGALEAGVNFVSTYPGTPVTEIGDIFYKIAEERGAYFEFSTNEKVALEAGIGASYSGLKTLVTMKHFGLNVCLDALVPFVYTGAKGPTVIVTADDPSCHSSAQSEQDSRAISYLAHIPTLEPSDSQECKDFTKLAFQISEKYNIPVMLRLTTRVAHQRMPVVLGEMPEKKTVEGNFVKEPKRFVTFPPRVLEMKEEVFKKIKKIKEYSEKIDINFQKNNKGKTSVRGVGLIAFGVGYLYALEALEELDLNLPILKIGFFYPLPEEKIRNFIKNLKKVLVVEELDSYVEREVERLAKNSNPKLQIFGEEMLPAVGEIKAENVRNALIKITGVKYPAYKIKKIDLPRRNPRLCEGCPYWLAFSAIKNAVNPKEVIFGGDIGCYMLAGFPPNSIQDYLLCMGSSIGIAHGIRKAIHPRTKFGAGASQKLIAFIGDSTFFHAGIPALINTVFNKSNPLIVILDNETTAMTGHQPNPGNEGIKIEEIVRACGVKNLKILDPVNQDEFTRTVKEFLAKDEVSVIISRRICALLAKMKKN